MAPLVCIKDCLAAPARISWELKNCELMHTPSFLPGLDSMFRFILSICLFCLFSLATGFFNPCLSDARASLMRPKSSDSLALGDLEICKKSLRRCLVESSADQNSCILNIVARPSCSAFAFTKTVKQVASLSAHVQSNSGPTNLALTRCLEEINSSLSAWLINNESNSGSGSDSDATLSLLSTTLESHLTRCEKLLNSRNSADEPNGY